MPDTGQAPAREELAQFTPSLSGYRILSEIGRGGAASVWVAEDESLGRKVAIKVLHPEYRHEFQVRTRFMQEARAIAMLSHPNIVHIYSLGKLDDLPHFVMEYVEGVPLTEAADALPLQRTVELMRKVALAVEFLHQHGIVHRDLKPQNILVGADLEPKLLDFGLARLLEDQRRLTQSGELLGTPNYLSPEQTRVDATLDARTDVFSLGTILYELLTGTLPFRGENVPDQIASIRGDDPVLPRRLNATVPGDLQNICLKALEKNPADRYASAREMANDLSRYLAHEPVLANPTAYSRLMTGKMQQHLRELDGWRQDNILSEYEYDRLRKGYDRLVDREDAWIMEFRRLSPSQVSLYLGAWVMVLGAALVFLFNFPGLTGTRAVGVVLAATIPTAAAGVYFWRAGRTRIAIAYLLAFCLLLPVTLLVAMGQYGWLAHFTRGRENLELFAKVDIGFRPVTNAQMWWAIALSLPAYVWLRRFTKASVFSGISAVMLAGLSIVTLLRLGMLEWIDTDPGRVYLRMIPIALLFFIAAVGLEHQQQSADSRYFYPIAVCFTFVALSGVASVHKPYADWLQRLFPWTRGQIEYLFIINAAVYFVLQWITDRFHTPQMRMVAKAFRFVIPGHVMTSLLFLGIMASARWEEAPAFFARKFEARFFEFLLPAVACVFIFGSLPKQMKNYLATGLLFLAIGVIRLQNDFFKQRASWPIILLAVGVVLMFTAVDYPAILVRLRRLKR